LGFRKERKHPLRREPHPNPSQSGGNILLLLPLWGGDCVIAQEMTPLLFFPIYMRKYLTQSIIESYSLPSGEGWGGVFFFISQLSKPHQTVLEGWGGVLLPPGGCFFHLSQSHNSLLKHYIPQKSLSLALNLLYGVKNELKIKIMREI
jgi:hypothetical protein